ncbi:TROVE domain-containing protein [Dyadobacter diqingensis]|uniref:TROVE domain-containing protein n=1 Tax=Dyadobacter diqingensis TaxID=2938121 RepID=UPI0020C1AFE9|nr:TROVE domain-containing protein [Dyadobacter diqingensis]
MRFNTQKSSITQVKNYEGAKAFVLNPAMQLYTAVVTWSLNDSFYEKNDDRLLRIRTLIAQNDPLFVARLAIYARHNMYMRSAPLVLLTELAKIHSGDQLISKLTEKVVSRADEITELLACYQLLNERKGLKKLNSLSKQLQKGLSLAFNNFDAYQFAKYNRDSEIKLRDALFLVHPKAKNDAQQQLFNKIASNKLETPYTWETELSALGQDKFTDDQEKSVAFKRKWEELIDSNKLGYMALLRNLRNLVEANISYEHLQKVCDTLSAADKVARAKQFPFRYLAAYRELLQAGVRVKSQGVTGRLKTLFQGDPGFTGELLDALEKAVTQSAANIAGFDENTKVLLACDVSGSMQVPVSAKSKIQLFDVGLVLAMLLQSRCKNVRIGMFGDTWKTIMIPKNNILANVQEFYGRQGEVGYATNGHLVIKDLLAKKIVMDKVMLFTDCQLWNTAYGTETIHSLWIKYKNDVAPEARLYLFDLQGYGQSPLQLIQNDVYLLAGWSDKIFAVLDALENGKKSLDEINAIKI